MTTIITTPTIDFDEQDSCGRRTIDESRSRNAILLHSSNLTLQGDALRYLRMHEYIYSILIYLHSFVKDGRS